MLYEQTLSQFQEELDMLQFTSLDFPTEIQHGHALCTRTLNQMRQLVIEHGFKDTQHEIRFFKEIKVVPMSHLIYYAEASSCIANKPKNHLPERLKYIKKQIVRVDSFLTKQIDFLVYMESKDDHLDQYYFTRGHMKQSLVTHRYPYLKDPDFHTDKDYLLAKIRGFGMYVAFLKREQQALVTKEDTTAGLDSSLRFTGKPIELVELIYALEAVGVFNHGNAGIADIVRGLGDIIDMDVKEVYKKYENLKTRKDKIIFLKRLIAAFIKRIEDWDALNPDPT